MGPICAALEIDRGASSHWVIGGVLIEGFIFDDAASSEGRYEPGPCPATELGIDGTDDNIIRDGAIETMNLDGCERREWNREWGFWGVEGRELVDKFRVNLANGIDVEETWVLEGLEELMIDVVDSGRIFLVVILLYEGNIGVGIVGGRGGNIELGGGGEDAVLCRYNVCVSVLVV